MKKRYRREAEVLFTIVDDVSDLDERTVKLLIKWLRRRDHRNALRVSAQYAADLEVELVRVTRETS